MPSVQYKAILTVLVVYFAILRHSVLGTPFVFLFYFIANCDDAGNARFTVTESTLRPTASLSQMIAALLELTELKPKDSPLLAAN